MRKGFTPLEKASDFNRRSLPIKADGGIKPPSAQAVRGRSSLTGFTFIEAIISVSILAFIALSIYGVLNVGDMTWRTEMTLMGLQQEVRLAMDGMTREIRRSKSSYITISGTTGNKRIDFSIDDPDTGSTYSISYYLSNSCIVREYPSGTTKILARNVSSLNFSSSSNEISVNITASKTERGRPLQFSLTEKVRLRNE